MKRKLPPSEVISSEKEGGRPSFKRPDTRDTVRHPVADELNKQYRRPQDNYTDKRPSHV